MSQNQITLDEDVAALLGDTPEQIKQAAVEIIALDLYRRHVISAGRAAELLRRDKWEFIRWSGSLGVPYFDMTLEELREELRIFEKLDALVERSNTPNS